MWDIKEEDLIPEGKVRLIVYVVCTAICTAFGALFGFVAYLPVRYLCGVHSEGLLLSGIFATIGLVMSLTYAIYIEIKHIKYFRRQNVTGK